MVEDVARRRGHGAADDPGAARRAPRPAAARRAGGARARRGRGSGVPPRRRAGARAGRAAGRGPAARRSCARSSCGRASATCPDDDAFRFRHILIRDAAYDALPKATRADLHERFARLARGTRRRPRRARRDRRPPPRAGVHGTSASSAGPFRNSPHERARGRRCGDQGARQDRHALGRKPTLANRSLRA